MHVSPVLYILPLAHDNVLLINYCMPGGEQFIKVSADDITEARAMHGADMCVAVILPLGKSFKCAAIDSWVKYNTVAASAEHHLDGP